MSLWMSCSCRLMVCVETTTRQSLVGGGGEDGGDEVGKALADAGAGLDHEVALGGDGVGDGVGHVELLGGAPRSLRSFSRHGAIEPRIAVTDIRPLSLEEAVLVRASSAPCDRI